METKVAVSNIRYKKIREEEKERNTQQLAENIKYLMSRKIPFKII